MPISAIVIMVFMATALISSLLLYMIVPKNDILQERLGSIAPRAKRTGLMEKKPPSWLKFLDRLGKKVPLRPQEYGKYTRNLLAAGIRREMFPVFMGAKIFFMAVFPLLYIMFYGMPLGNDRPIMVILTFALAIFGFLLPSYWLKTRIRKRKLSIFHDLPDVLDLMTVCVEAGLSMDAAILRIANDRQFRKSPLSRELLTATQETRAGKPRYEALKDLGERTMLDDMKSFVSMLIQTEQLGTSLAQSLRVHSDSLRTIRRQKAEEAAAKTSIKLLFPLVFLLMPSIFVVVLLPAILRLMKFFSTM